MDQVDKVISQWHLVRPDIDTSSMEIIGRITRVAKQILEIQEITFAKYGLNLASFDALSALRRSGPPYALTAGELMSAMMITSGTMTNRIDQLRKVGLVTRELDPKDARRAIVTLTDQGFQVIERAIIEHGKTQRQILSGMTQDELGLINSLFRKLSEIISSS
ncbi:MarR family winged helix-turn-helix transcriptional regulator [Acetobacter indonesiensis]|uniref:MarR family winged helix-turn-helix transcriptional regulator n=1 Tax=Acetobacter indonesiensis TaxID=104101 RepID=UPI0020A29686|nr:MarR family transcriptional regulator [Acetobacter indonesiensis]MCP1232026.1 MarR family transcriptional regulator [Acetobacter indonesiensis]